MQAVRRRLWILEFYSSAIAKKWTMAVTGIILIGYIVFHMVGNLKIFLGEEAINNYAEFLRDVGEPVAPRTNLLWIARVGLLAATVLHLHAAATLNRLNRKAAPAYHGPRNYVVASYASRTMLWGGIIIFLFVLFHLADLTWGQLNPDFVRGEVYDNLVASFSRWPVASFYILANLALGVHLYHGAWSLFQSLGWSHPRFNHWRSWLAKGLALGVTAGNLSIPLAVMTGWID